jgi:hypothetical protein
MSLLDPCDDRNCLRDEAGRRVTSAREHDVDKESPCAQGLSWTKITRRDCFSDRVTVILALCF